MRLSYIKKNSVLVVLCCAWLVTQTNLAAANNEFEDHAMQVRELLAIEQQRLREQSDHPDESLSPGLASPAGSAPTLAAIYGVGQRLLAEVYLEGTTYLYLHDHDFPIGYKADNDLYRLIAISEQCVTLGREQHELTQCLHPTLNKRNP